MAETQTTAPMNLLEGGAKFRERVSNPAMFRVYMLVKMPVLGVTGAYIEDIGTERCEMVLPYGFTTRNLFGKMVDSAIIACAETASAALTVLHVRNQDAALTAEMVGIRGEFDGALEQDVRVICPDGERYADFVRRAKEAGEPVEETFSIEVRSKGGERLRDIELTWRLRAK